jgi:hypothetical protein
MNTENKISCADLPDELKPCGHMVDLVSRRSDGSLSGPAKWYTDFHVMTCPHCRSALHGLKELRSDVAELAVRSAGKELHLGEAEWERIDTAIKG